MTNLDYFEYSKEHLEDLFDSYYSKGIVVIPRTITETNTLIENNNKLIELISAFNVLIRQGKDYNNESMRKIVNDVIAILDNTPLINFSSFVQYFMVNNVNYSIYRKLKHDIKSSFIYEMLTKYCLERHELYLSHGYTNSILQVMCDNYSHKRNGKTGINKFIELINPLNVDRIYNDEILINTDNYYFLPDKGDSDMFETFVKLFDIEMKSREIEQNKLPDVVLKYKGQYYICELKTMKEDGGGQNKQIVEIAYFIKFQEKNDKIHYITFLDGLYYNKIITDNSPKIVSQRMDIETALKNNAQNYFFNTKSFIRFVEDIR